MDLEDDRYRHGDLEEVRSILRKDDDTLRCLANLMSDTLNDQAFLQRMEVLFLIKDRFSGLHG